MIRKNKYPCSQRVYVWLAFLLGNMGAHNFYTGYRKKAFIQLALGWGGGIVASYMSGYLETHESTSVFIMTLGIIAGLCAWYVAIWNAFEIFKTSKSEDGRKFDPIDDTTRKVLGRLQAAWTIILPILGVLTVMSISGDSQAKSKQDNRPIWINRPESQQTSHL